ncbi:hypothetical protein TVAG_008120 [Trichomonas vaginalis G3]|uniref:Uncharacterized protein n=1 Tax=Trichomonas vaginalis (strain ATCC PRA-98 / G3) TaxID=412133 RepID=A2EX27_TRIV3|nr:hypothetical protein TVAGG3_0442560 [Trichomonas vaginalis G3]EAY02804.1 hypothetical protein TVAG_008120 [Trichomonas vaginalis G3]KAI5537570.1 hypothetical protein TVAGG3_0442560 [Trichomonas vaginalis G3]|eukprot:XP_001315027.1 hypothetical protein [Trichomonas vaginalis G3]
MTKQSSHGDVQMRDLLSATISKCVQMLADCTKYSSSPNAAKHRLLINLMKSRILIARLLVALRFMKYPCIKLLNNVKKKELNNNAQICIKGFQNILRQIQEKPLAPLKIEDIEDLTEAIEIKQNEVLNADFTFLFMNKIPQRLTFHKIVKNRAYFACKGEYSFIIRKSKNNAFKLKLFTINWPPNLSFPDILLKYISKLIQYYLETPISALTNIDNVLHLMYSTASLPLLAIEFEKVYKLFNYVLTRKTNKLFIAFGKKYGFHGKFKFEMDHDVLKITSCAPIFVPTSLLPNDPFVPTQFIATPHTFALPNSGPAIPSLFIIGLPYETFKYAEELLGFMRDVSIYTRLRNIWEPLMRSLALMGGSFLEPKFEYNKKVSSLSRIEVYNSVGFYLLSITCDAYTGSLFIDIYNTKTKLHDNTIYSNAYQLGSMVQGIGINLVFRIATRIMTNSISPSSYNNPYINFMLSYSNYFYIHYQSSNGYPAFEIYDINGNSYICPDIIKSQNLATANSWRKLSETAIAVCNFIFILETERLLKEKGFKTVRSPVSVEFLASNFSTCKISVISPTAWKLTVKIHSPLVPFLFDSSYSVIGSIKNARSAEQSVECFMFFAKMFDIIAHSSFILTNNYHDKESCYFSGFLVDDTVGNIEVKNLPQIAGSNKKKVYWKLINNFPSVSSELLIGGETNWVLSAILDQKNPSPLLAGFLASSSLLMKRIKTNLNSNWSIVHQGSTNVFHLIAFEKYTISCEIRPTNIVLIYCSPIPPASSVLIPLLSAKVLEAGNGRTNIRLRMSLDELIKTLPKIEFYLRKIGQFAECGFKFIYSQIPRPHMSIDVNNMKADIYYDSINLRCSDPSISVILQSLPTTPEFVISLLNIPNPQLQKSYSVVLSAVFSLSSESAVISAKSVNFRGNRVYLSISGFPFEIIGTTARCGEMSFRTEDVNEVKAALANLF